MKTEEVLECVAKNYNVSVDEVKKEIEFAIRLGMKNRNQYTKFYWKAMSKNGKQPTIDDVIFYIAEEIKSKERKSK